MQKSLLMTSALIAGTLMLPNFHKSAYAQIKTPFTIAHRGNSYYAPEHTMEAFDQAVRKNAKYLEMDIQITKDGYLVPFHDGTIERTTNGTGRVRDYTLKELQKLDAGSWFNAAYPKYAKNTYINQKIPTLDQVLTRYGRETKYYIELKRPEENKGMEKRLVTLLKKHGYLNEKDKKKQSIVVESFSSSSLKKLDTYSPYISKTQSVRDKYLDTATSKDLVNIKKYADTITVSKDDITKTDVAKLHRSNLKVSVYTVDDIPTMKKLIEYGVDGVYTNRPGTYIKVKKTYE